VVSGNILASVFIRNFKDVRNVLVVWEVKLGAHGGLGSYFSKRVYKEFQKRKKCVGSMGSFLDLS